MQAAEEKMQAVGALREELQAMESELADLRNSYAEICAHKEELVAEQAQMEKKVGGALCGWLAVGYRHAGYHCTRRKVPRRA